MTCPTLSDRLRRRATGLVRRARCYADVGQLEHAQRTRLRAEELRQWADGLEVELDVVEGMERALRRMPDTDGRRSMLRELLAVAQDNLVAYRAAGRAEVQNG